MANTFIGVLTVLLAVGPGYAFLRVVEPRRYRWEHSPLLELTELLIVGAASTAATMTVAVAIAAGLGEVSWRSLLRDPSAYLRVRPGPTLAIFAGAVLGSYILAHYAARFLYRDVEPLRSPGTVWTNAVEASRDANLVDLVRGAVDPPEGLPVLTTVELRDGRTVAGYLFDCSEEDDIGKRDLSLRAPIQVSADGTDDFVELLADFIVIPSAEIRLFTLRQVSS